MKLFSLLPKRLIHLACNSQIIYSLIIYSPDHL